MKKEKDTNTKKKKGIREHKNVGALVNYKQYMSKIYDTTKQTISF